MLNVYSFHIMRYHKDTKMPTPKDVFDNPLQHIDFLKSIGFEGQYFERKEVCTESVKKINKLRETIKKTISAFANTNRQGGLLILGIADEGKIKGIQHVEEKVMKDILKIRDALICHTTWPKLVDIDDCGNQLYLLYTLWSEKAICETFGNFPEGWRRDGSQNFQLTQLDRDMLKREKKIVDFELSYCCPYNHEELDEGVVEEFRNEIQKRKGALYNHSTENILENEGVIILDENGKYAFTNAGYLFFASNPRKRFANAFVRLLRYDSTAKDLKNRGGMTLDKDFDGPLPNIIRDLRTFLKDSALFRTLSKRKQDGGFIDEPEFPFITVDEALVNAIIHRDYGVTTPIQCVVYRDSLIVTNPGSIPQHVPDSFNLGDIPLKSVPRNPKIVEWMRVMKDEQGSAFVRSLSEGTTQMYNEMEKLRLPSPHYKTDQYTTVTLYSKFDERLEKSTLKTVTETQEYTNLFPLIEQSSAQSPRKEFRELRKNVLTAIKDALSNHGWFIDDLAFGRIVAHRKGNTFLLSQKVEEIARIYPAYVFQVREYAQNLYLCLDYKVELKSVEKVDRLLRFMSPDKIIGKRATAEYSGEWRQGKILEIDSEMTKLVLFDLKTEVDLPNNKVIPSLRKVEIKQILKERNVTHNLDEKINQYALLSQRNAAKTRSEKTLKIVQQLADEVFPVKVNNLTLKLSKVPVTLKIPPSGGSSQDIEPLTVFHESDEPPVRFYNSQVDTNILDGLTKYSSYHPDIKDIELIPICTPDFRGGMQQLIDRLKHGKYKYRGVEWTFKTKLTYPNIIPIPIEEYEIECKRLLHENPKWVGNEGLNRLFLVYVPEDRFPITDLNSPYYTIKEFLLAKGIPVQMVDTPTLNNADWKDYNLALNITAKCGVVPWVLPGALPDADFFVGLSYTQHPDRKIDRHMAFANVFSDYGLWKFYQGNTKPFNYEERHEFYKDLVRSTLEQLDLRESPSIHFHYSAKFSAEDRDAILEAAKSVRPNGKYTFVWINSKHIVRFYDPSPQTDGSLQRGKYVIGWPNQFYLSTTGYNTYHKALGTPHPLEVNVWTEPYDPSNPPDLKIIAKQLISLTKLNWASTRSFCGTPITIKYARDIARFASAFIERNEKFELHEVLEKTPWFI